MSEPKDKFDPDVPYLLRGAKGESLGIYVGPGGHLTDLNGGYLGRVDRYGTVYDAQGGVMGHINPITGHIEQGGPSH